jgi:excisionase family DNA binding protein
MEDLELIDKAELAALFRVPQTWVDEAVTARRIPFTRLGHRHIRFSRDNVREIHRLGLEPAMTA